MATTATKEHGALTDEQKVAAQIFTIIFPHKLMMLQREIEATKESINFCKIVIDTVKENF